MTFDVTRLRQDGALDYKLSSVSKPTLTPGELLDAVGLHDALYALKLYPEHAERWRLLACDMAELAELSKPGWVVMLSKAREFAAGDLPEEEREELYVAACKGTEPEYVMSQLILKKNASTAPFKLRGYVLNAGVTLDEIAGKLMEVCDGIDA